MDIVRYDFIDGTYGGQDFIVMEKGGYVDFEDYELLRAENARLQSVIDAANAQEPLGWVFPDDFEKLSNSECAADIYSVEQGHPSRGVTLPLYARPIPAQKSIEQAHMAGQSDAGVDPSYSNAQAYAISVGAQQSPAVAVPEKIGFSDSFKICEIGFTNWRLKDHNKKWFKKIDGTPIHNDLLCCIAEAFSSHYETEDLMEFHAVARHEEMRIPSPRITEQDARATIADYIDWQLVSPHIGGANVQINLWLKDSGRALLNKLNKVNHETN